MPDMTLNPSHLLTILGMALVTYGIRFGGLMLSQHLPDQGRIAHAMKALPGVVLISLCAPAVYSLGPVGAAAGAVTALVMWRSHNVLYATIAGVLFIAGLRQFL